MITVENKKMFGWTVTGLVSMALFLFFVPLNPGIKILIALPSAAACSYFLLKAEMKFPWNRSFFSETYSRINEVLYIVLAPLFLLMWCVIFPFMASMQ